MSIGKQKFEAKKEHRGRNKGFFGKEAKIACLILESH